MATAKREKGGYGGRPHIPAVGRGHSQGMVKEGPAGDQGGSIVGEDSLSAALDELHGQHPQKWDDTGPHHG